MTKSRARRIGLVLVGLFLLGGYFVGFLGRPYKMVGPKLEPYARLAPDLLAEASGMVPSRQYPDTFWLHNDSGSDPHLFAVDLQGSMICSQQQRDKGIDESNYPGLSLLGASNYDWEDIAIDGETLFVGDFGNNANARRDLGLYLVTEPDPRQVSEVDCKFVKFRYPDQTSFPPLTSAWEFDCEAMFVLDGKPYLLTKHRPAFRLFIPGQGTKLYRLDSLRTDQEQTLVLVDRHQHLGGWVTAADIAQDNSRIAVLIADPPNFGLDFRAALRRLRPVPLPRSCPASSL